MDLDDASLNELLFAHLSHARHKPRLGATRIELAGGVWCRMKLAKPPEEAHGYVAVYAWGEIGGLDHDRTYLVEVGGYGEAVSDAASDAVVGFADDLLDPVLRVANPGANPDSVARASRSGPPNLAWEVFVGRPSISVLMWVREPSPMSAVEATVKAAVPDLVAHAVAEIKDSTDASRHWLKTQVIFQASGDIRVAAEFDNRPAPEIEHALASLDWPTTNAMVVVRQILTLRPSTGPQRVDEHTGPSAVRASWARLFGRHQRPD